MYSCPKCWDNPCSCGYMWKGYSIRELERALNAIKRAIDQKKIEDWDERQK